MSALALIERVGPSGERAAVPPVRDAISGRWWDLVATPLEKEFSTIAGIDNMSSTSSLGNTSITLQFALERDIDGAAQDTGLAPDLLKAVIAALTVAVLGFGPRIALMTGLALAQIGEFSFVLAGVGRDNGLLPGDTFQAFVASSILTILATPFLIQADEEMLERALENHRHLRPTDADGEAEILLSLNILTRIKCISRARQQPGSWRLRERWWTTTHTRAAPRRLPEDPRPASSLD